MLAGAKQVGQLAPGSPRLLDGTFRCRALSNIRVCISSNQLSFGRLLGYVLVGVWLLCFFFTCCFFFHQRPNGRNINAGSSCSMTHCQTPVRKLVSGGLTKMEVEFKFLDTLNFSLSLLSHSHFLSSYFKQARICCHSCSLMKENQALKI